MKTAIKKAATSILLTVSCIGLAQVVARGAAGFPAATHPDGTNITPVLPQVPDSSHFFEQHPATQEQRGIGIAPQSSEPAIGPQINEPMIGQQGPPPSQTGLAEPAQVLPPGIRPGLSDQGLIWPAPGTIVVSPQAEAEAEAAGTWNPAWRNGTTGNGTWRGGSRGSGAWANRNWWNQNVMANQANMPAPDQRGIGIAPQSSEPAIAPQFNEPMIGQQGPPPGQMGLAQPAQLVPPGIRPGLSDQGLIWPAPGTIAVCPQLEAEAGAWNGTWRNGAWWMANVHSGRANDGRESSPGTQPGAINPALSPANSFNPQGFQTPLNTFSSPALTPTGRGATGATGTGAAAGAARGAGTGSAGATPTFATGE